MLQRGYTRFVGDHYLSCVWTPRSRSTPRGPQVRVCMLILAVAVAVCADVWKMHVRMRMYAQGAELRVA